MEPPLGRRLYLGHRAVHDALDERMGERGASLWHWILLRNAAENAEQIMDDLTLEMNRVRQSEITQQILEVVSGAEALG